MSQAYRMIDVAEDLMHDLSKHDAGRQHGVPSPGDRSAASVLRRNGFSDAEIVQRFGYLPEPYERPASVPVRRR